MTLSVNINDREFAKFCETGGETAVRTCTTLEGGGRMIGGGECFFGTQHKDDRVTYVGIEDIDNVLGYGAGTVLKTYHDEEVPEENQGWRIPSKFGEVEVESLGFYGWVPAELWIVIKGKKGSGEDTFYANFDMGISDAI